MVPKTPPTRSELEGMKRSELQKLSKNYNIKANLKSEALIEELLQHFKEEGKRSASDQVVSDSTSRPSRLKPRSATMPSHLGVTSPDVIELAEPEGTPPPIRGESRATKVRQSLSRSGRLKVASGTIDIQEAPKPSNNMVVDEQPESQEVIEYEKPLDQPVQPVIRTRKAKETQTRLGVGRPKAVGGLGPRKSTTASPLKTHARSTSTRAKGKTRTLQTVEDMIEDDEKQASEPPAASITLPPQPPPYVSQAVASPARTSILVSDPHAFRVPGAGSQLSKYSDEALSQLEARVAQLEQTRGVVKEMVLLQDDATAPESSMMAELRNELKELRSLKTSLEALEEEIVHIKLESQELQAFRQELNGRKSDSQVVARDVTQSIPSGMELDPIESRMPATDQNTKIEIQLKEQAEKIIRIEAELAELKGLHEGLKLLRARVQELEQGALAPRKVSGDERSSSPGLFRSPFGGTLAPAPTITSSGPSISTSANPITRAKSPGVPFGRVVSGSDHHVSHSTSQGQLETTTPAALPSTTLYPHLAIQSGAPSHSSTVLGKRSRDSSASDASPAPIVSGSQGLRRELLTRGHEKPAKKRVRLDDGESNEHNVAEDDHAGEKVTAVDDRPFSFADPPPSMKNTISPDFFAAPTVEGDGRRPITGGTIGRSASYAAIHKDEPPISALPYPLIATKQPPPKLIPPMSPSPQKGSRGLYPSLGPDDPHAEGSSSRRMVGKVPRHLKPNPEGLHPYSAPMTPKTASRRARSKGLEGDGNNVDSSKDSPPQTVNAPTALTVPSPLTMDDDPIERFPLARDTRMMFQTPKGVGGSALEDPTPPPMGRTMYGTERAGDNRFEDPGPWSRW